MHTEEKNNLFLTAKIDRIFKSILVQENDYRLMEAILTEILEKKVKIIKYLKTELPIYNKNEKVKVTDLLMEAEEELFHVEINTCFDEATRARNLSYFGAFYSQKTRRGKRYDTKTKVLHIDLNFNQSALDLPKRKFKIMAEEDQMVYANNFEIITINIASYKRNWYDKNRKEKIHLVMLDADEKELKELSKKDRLVKEYEEKLLRMNKDGVFVRELTEEEDKEYLLNTRIELAHEKGLEQGKEKEQKKIIKNMLECGIKKEEIQKIVNITPKEYQKLLKD